MSNEGAEHETVQMLAQKGELQSELLWKSSKLIVLKSYLRGHAAKNETQFQSQVFEFLGNWYAKLVQMLAAGGIFEKARVQGELLNKMSLTTEERTKLAEERSAALFSPIVDRLLDQPERKDLIQLLHDFSLDQYEEGAITALQSMGFTVLAKRESQKAEGKTVQFGLEDKHLLSTLENRAIKHGNGVFAETIQDARKVIRDVVFINGGSVDQAAQALVKSTKIPEWRALKIARTETQQAFNGAMFDTFGRSGVKAKKWITVGDARVRPEHTLNEGAGWIPIASPFPSGQMHPGDGTLSINCRCSLIPDLSDPNILIQPWDGSSYFMPGESLDVPEGSLVFARPKEEWFQKTYESGLKMTKNELQGQISRLEGKLATMDKTSSEYERTKAKYDAYSQALKEKYGLIDVKPVVQPIAPTPPPPPPPQLTVAELRLHESYDRYMKEADDLDTYMLLKRIDDYEGVVQRVGERGLAAHEKVKLQAFKDSLNKRDLSVLYDYDNPSRLSVERLMKAVDKPSEELVLVDQKIAEEQKVFDSIVDRRRTPEQMEATKQELADSAQRLQLLRARRKELAESKFDEFLALPTDKRVKRTYTVYEPGSLKFKTLGKNAAEQGQKFIDKIVPDEVVSKYMTPMVSPTTGRGYYKSSGRILGLGVEDSPHTYVHEYGHLLEDSNAETRRLAQRFLARRTKGEVPQSLRSIYSDRGYRSDEMARRDKFMSAYMGKEYTHDSTEIISMGLEYMYSKPLEFARRDPEMFEFILAVARGDMKTARFIAEIGTDRFPYGLRP